MSQQTVIAPRLPAEYRGAARVFRSEVDATDKAMDAVIADIIKPLNSRLRRHPRLRDEQIKVAVATYRKAVPTQFRIGDLDVHADRDRFSVAETRLSASSFRLLDWQNSAVEPGVVLGRCGLTMQGRQVLPLWKPQVVVSLHALARRIERGGGERAGLLRDLALLAGAADNADERIVTPGGGWLGASMPVAVGDATVVVLSVRTWVAG